MIKGGYVVDASEGQSTANKRTKIMYQYGKWTYCVKCSAMVAVVAISAAGEAILERHPSTDIKVDMSCRMPDDLPSRMPYTPFNSNPQSVAMTTSSSSSVGSVSS